MKKKKLNNANCHYKEHTLLRHIVSQTAVHSDESHIAVSDKCVKPSVHL